MAWRDLAARRLDEARRQLIDMHKRATAHAKIVQMKTGRLSPVFDLEKSLRMMFRREQRHAGNTSNYAKPHQGAQECARRLQQREQHGHFL